MTRHSSRPGMESGKGKQIDNGRWYFWNRRSGQPWRWPPEVQEKFNDVACEMCHRLFGDHSLQEFSDCMDGIADKHGIGWRKKHPHGSK